MTNLTNGSKPTVLLIDDERYPLLLYIKALTRAGFAVDHRQSVAEALQPVDRHLNIVIILLDIMMFPGEFYRDKDHREGIKTGVFLYHDLLRLYPGLPIIVVTNVNDQEIISDLASERPAPIIVNKVDYPPMDLAELVQRAIHDSGKE